MTRSSLSLFALTAVLLITGAGPSVREIPPDHTKTLVRYFLRHPMSSPYGGAEVMSRLRRQGFDIAGFNWQAGEIEVITDEAGLQRLQAEGWQGRTVESFAPGETVAPDAQYLTAQKVDEALHRLNAAFPHLTRLEQIGTSLRGRPIWALLLSTTARPQDQNALAKPSIIFDGLHHAREIMTSEVVLDVAQYLLEEQARGDARSRAILERWNVWVVPMLNVDGNELVWTRDPWWRKNARATDDRVHGVDLNRNYPFKWSACNGSSSNRDSQDYHGPTAASEPETQAIMRLGAHVQPTASLSYHSYSELVLFPYSCEGYISGDNALLAQIGKELAEQLPRDDGRGKYGYGTPWQILYGADGDSMSYLHSEFGTTAFAFEINQAFQPPYSQRAPTLVKHRRAWQFFLERLERNLLHLTVVDEATGSALPSTVEISTIAHRYGEKPLRTNSLGHFFKVLDPGRYTLRLTAQDGRRLEIPVEMTGQALHLTARLPRAISQE